MTNSQKVHLSLFENSHSFLNEAVDKALAATTDMRQWQFALTALVQSLELSLKELLRRIHPVLIFENIDSPKNTIRPSVAIERLENPKIGKMKFAATEKTRIHKAIDLRNQIIHSEFELKPEYATAKFFELFAFVAHFQGRYLDTEIESIVSEDHMSQLISIEKALEKLHEKALRRIEDENIDSDLVWSCPQCSHDTFVIQDSIDTCYTCRHKELVVECHHCDNFFFECEIESFFEDIDTDYSEGQTIIHNNYGYSNYSACPDCLLRIKDDIQNQRDEEDYYRSMEEYYQKKS